MNFHIVAKLLGLLLFTFAASMLPSLGWSLYYGDGVWGALVKAMIGTAAGAALLYIWGSRRPQEIFRKEATAVVGLGWLLAAAAGALPFYFANLREMSSITDCLFESMSGLTTTGATVLDNIEALPESILFWRNWTQWLGGLGIIMLFVAILPYLGAGGRALVKSEVTGPVKEGLTPRIKDTARLLYGLYIGYTIVEIGLLWALTEMNLFHASCHTFSTLATGGFSTRNDSIMAFDSGRLEFIIIVFMVLAGMNFALMHKFFTGRSWKLWQDAEWRVYMMTIGASTLFVAVILYRSTLSEYAGEAGRALRDALFTVVSLGTGTGYVTADFEQWPVAVKCVLLILMFVGGCAGSTAGGLKVMRLIILFKIGRLEVEKIFRPRTVRKIRLGGSVLNDDLQQAIVRLFLLWMIIFVAGALAIGVIEGRNLESWAAMGGMDLLTPFSAAASTLNNIGPGFSLIGATHNYAPFSDASKWILSLLMVLGRLELYSILVLFFPAFWRVK